MSLIHFSEFIEDVQRINPRFRERTSSLRPFIKVLREAQHHPRPQGPGAVNYIAEILSDRRVEKYLPAIENVLSVWGRGLKTYPSGSHLKQVSMNRICFRGDSRSPDEIFAQGFLSRRAGQIEYRNYHINAHAQFGHAVDPEILPIHGMQKAGDITPQSAVCVTNDMDASALFPLPSRHDRLERIYIYVVFVESGAHTHTRQVLDALGGMQAMKQRENEGLAHSQARLDNLTFTLYGREMATKTIAPANVWAAMRVKRKWNKMETRIQPLSGNTVYDCDYTLGGTYTIEGIQFNETAFIPDGFQGPFLHFCRGIDKLIGKHGSTRRLPVMSDGYRPTNTKALS